MQISPTQIFHKLPGMTETRLQQPNIHPYFHPLHFYTSRILIIDSVLVLLLKGFLVEPWPENGERRGVLNLRLGPPQGSVIVPQWVRGQHDGQLQLDRLLQVAGGHNELEKKRRRERLKIMEYDGID